MPRTRKSYQRKAVVAVADQGKETKPDLSLPVKTEVKNNIEIPYKRRYFTAPRQVKAKRFVEKSTEDPNAYGLVGSTVWFDGLLKEINEPEVITWENIRDWMTKNPVFFKPQAVVPRQRRSSARRFQVKTEIKLEKEIKIEPEVSDDSLDNIFDVVTLPRPAVVKSEPVDDSDTDVNYIEEVLVNDKKLELEATVCLQPTDTDESSPPFFDISEPSPISFCGESEKASSEVYIVQEPQSQDTEFKRPHTAEIEEVGANVDVNTATTELSSDSGVQTEEHVLVYNNSSTLVGPQVFAVNSQDFLEFAQSVGTFDRAESPGSPSVYQFTTVHCAVVPDARVTKLQDNLTRFSRVMEKLEDLIDSFEHWHGFLIEPRNSEASKNFGDLRKTLDDLENGYIQYVVNSPNPEA